MPELLELSDIQGNVVQGYSLPRAMHMFIEIRQAAGGRALLAKLVPELTAASPWPGDWKPESTLNVALSYDGLQALDVSPGTLEDFPASFREGMRKRSALLGDDTGSWEAFWREHRPHVWLSVYATEVGELARRGADVKAIIESCDGVSLLGYCDVAAVIRVGDRRVEHFGFADGLSNPIVAGTEANPTIAGDPTTSVSGHPLAAGEFLLGYADELGEMPPGPDPALVRNGTFVVYKKLRQDVVAFRKYVEVTALRHGLSREVLAAKMVGRYPDGRPLAPSPPNDPRLASDPNAFDFADDPAGAGCPLGAHIRRANPRNTRNLGNPAARHRMLRRGMPYGKPLPEGDPDDGLERGLLFIAMNASLERQYEFVQQRWMNDGVDQVQGTDPDPLIGAKDGPRKMVVQGDRATRRLPLILLELPHFVQGRGGEYFFMPGLSALRQLSTGRFSTTRAVKPQMRVPEMAS